MTPQLNFKQIDAFRSVMVAGSVVGAAKMMNVTQPGVSRTLALLELRLGYPLFVRRGRRMLPTPEADALFREVEHLYGGLNRISQLAQDIRFQRAGALRIAVLPGLSHGLVPRVASRFLAERPNVTIAMQSLPSRQIVELVASRQFDLGIVEAPLLHPGTVTTAMPLVRVVAVMLKDHPLASRGHISIKDLDGERLVLLVHGSFVRHQIDDWFSKLGATPKVVVETGHSTVACSLVAEGAGITLVSRTVGQFLVDPRLAICSVEEDITTGHALVHPQLASPMPLADAFAAEFLREFDVWHEAPG